MHWWDIVEGLHGSLSRRWREALALGFVACLLLFPDTTLGLMIWVATERVQPIVDSILESSSLAEQ